MYNSFTWGEAAALLRVSGRTVIHAARVLSEDSPAAPAVRRAVEQGRVTVSDASRVMDEPAEVQLRALERVTGGGSGNLAGAAQGAAPRGVDCGGGRGYRRCWADPMAGLANAGTMGLTSRRGHGGRCGGGGVRSGRRRCSPWGLAGGLLRAGYRLRPGERLRGGKRGTGRTEPWARLETALRTA